MDRAKFKAEIIDIGERYCILDVPHHYLALLRKYYHQHSGEVGVTFTPWGTAKDRAKGLFFAVRDRIVKAQSGVLDKEHCDLMKEQLKEEAHIYDEAGKLMSMRDMEMPHLWNLLQTAFRWAEEDPNVYVGDLRPDEKQLQYETQKETQRTEKGGNSG